MLKDIDWNALHTDLDFRRVARDLLPEVVARIGDPTKITPMTLIREMSAVIHSGKETGQVRSFFFPRLDEIPESTRAELENCIIRFLKLHKNDQIGFAAEATVEE